jgi:hypothetical protein
MLCTQSRGLGSDKPPELFVAEYCRLLEYFRSCLRLLSKLCLEVLLRVLTWLHRSFFEYLLPCIYSFFDVSTYVPRLNWHPGLKG